MTDPLDPTQAYLAEFRAQEAAGMLVDPDRDDWSSGKFLGELTGRLDALGVLSPYEVQVLTLLSRSVDCSDEDKFGLDGMGER